MLASLFGSADKGSNTSSGVAREVKEGAVLNEAFLMFDETMLGSSCNTGQYPKKPSEPGNWVLWKRSICSAPVSIEEGADL